MACTMQSGSMVSGMLLVWSAAGKYVILCSDDIVPGMVLASAGGTGPIFPGAPVPPDGNVANPTRPGTTLPPLRRQPQKVCPREEKSDVGQFY